MRLRSIALITALPSLLVACGGGGGDPDARPRIDMRTTPDAPPFVCGLEASYDTPTLGEPPGTGAGPFAFTAQRTTTTDDHAVVVLGIFSDVEPRAAMLMLLIDNAGMFMTGGAAGPFAGGPTGVDWPMDGGATCGGCVEGYTGYDLMGTNADLTTADQIYLIDTGTVAMDTFNPGAVANGTSQVFGSYNGLSMTAYETDPADPTMLIVIDKNADTVPDCTTTVNSLGFFFEPTWAPPTAVAPGVNPTGQLHGVDAAKIPTATIKL